MVVYYRIKIYVCKFGPVWGLGIEKYELGVLVPLDTPHGLEGYLQDVAHGDVVQSLYLVWMDNGDLANPAAEEPFYGKGRGHGVWISNYEDEYRVFSFKKAQELFESFPVG